MENGVRIQITLAKSVLEKLDWMCEEKGMRRSAVLALAFDKLWKEEQTGKK